MLKHYLYQKIFSSYMIHCMPAKRTALQGFNEFIEQTKKSYVRFNYQAGVFFFYLFFDKNILNIETKIYYVYVKIDSHNALCFIYLQYFHKNF